MMELKQTEDGWIPIISGYPYQEAKDAISREFGDSERS